VEATLLSRIKIHYEGRIPEYPNRHWIGGSDQIENARIVCYQGNKERILAAFAGKNVSGSYVAMTEENEGYCVVLLALHSLPAAPPPYILKADVNEALAYNIYQNGKPVSLIFVVAKAGSVSYTLPRPE